MLIALACMLGFSSVVLGGMSAFPMLGERMRDVMQRRATDAKTQLEDMFVQVSHRRLTMLHAIAPLVLTGIIWVLTGQWRIAIVGLVLGLIVPRMLVSRAKAKRTQAFHNQLVDGLLLISSCLRAGLSMNQAFTVMAEEMAPPISQEFGLLVKEMRMGVSLENALEHMMKRLPSDELHMFISTVLVARETGGDVTAVFVKLVETLRERKKIREKIKTLTFMAKLQGIIMAALPFIFFIATSSFNHDQHKFFLQDPQGRLMLAIVVFLQVMSACLFMRFSRSPL